MTKLPQLIISSPECVWLLSNLATWETLIFIALARGEQLLVYTPMHTKNNTHTHTWDLISTTPAVALLPLNSSTVVPWFVLQDFGEYRRRRAGERVFTKSRSRFIITFQFRDQHDTRLKIWIRFATVHNLHVFIVLHLLPFPVASLSAVKWQLLFPQHPHGNHDGETRLHPPLEENETRGKHRSPEGDAEEWEEKEQGGQTGRTMERRWASRQSEKEEGIWERKKESKKQIKAWETNDGASQRFILWDEEENRKWHGTLITSPLLGPNVCLHA